VSAINPLGAAGTQTTQASSAANLGGLTQNNFLQLLVAQMQNQDPLNPMSSDQFLQEMASFTEVVDLGQLQQQTQNLINNEVASQGLQLLGRTVTAIDPTSGQSVSGTVSQLTMQNGQPMLTIGSAQLPVSSVVTVQ
jgi:flagellar basal-body rod modification protein FlgD